MGAGLQSVQEAGGTGKFVLDLPLAYRVSLETLLTVHTIGKSPTELFYGITDNFWFWLNTEGIRKNSVLRNLLPGIADEDTQKMFTGKTGDQDTLGSILLLYTFQKALRKIPWTNLDGKNS